MNEVDILEELQKISERLDKLEKAILEMYQIQPIQPVIPHEIFKTEPVTNCHKCGLKLENAMGYVCSRNDCPIFIRVTC